MFLHYCFSSTFSRPFFNFLKERQLYRPHFLLISACLLLFLPLLSVAQDSRKDTLIVYSYDSFVSEWGPGVQIKEKFEAICQCDVVYKTPGSATNVIQAFKLEGHKADADILLGIDATLLNEVAKTDAILPHQLSWQNTALNGPLDWSSSPHQALFVPFNYGYFNFIYRQDALTDIPSSFEALLDSDLQLIIQDPRSSSPGMGLLLWVKALYGDNAQKAWNRMADNVLISTNDWSEAYNMFLEGRGDMVLSYSTSPVYHRLVDNDENYQAAWFSEGHILQSEYASIASSTKNESLANQFLEFLISAEAQYIIANKNWMLPVAKTSPDLDDNFESAKNNNTPNLAIDSEAFAKHKREWINEYAFGLAGQ